MSEPERDPMREVRGLVNGCALGLLIWGSLGLAVCVVVRVLT